MDRSEHRTGSRPSAAAGDREPRGRARQRAFAVAALTQPARAAAPVEEAAPDGAQETTGPIEELAELRELLHTAGVATVGEMVQRRERPHPNLYLGPGKVAELKEALEAADANVVAVDDELTPRQERNLEQELGVPVVDRTAVILDIFADHAHSAEGKLQVELAQLQYNLARMRGLWSHLERLGGGIGTRGPGETQIETDRRLARDRIAALRRKLDNVRSTRDVQRAERERARLPEVSLVGYTNAGKSTVLNALTGADVGVRDRLFHTLDPTTRTLSLDGRDVLLTDTVGFIRKLPHQLVDAFGATLEETRRADLLLHVLDGAAPEQERAVMQAAVEEVLDEIGADAAPRLLVLTKLDLADADAREELAFAHPDALAVSAETGEGLDALRAAIAAALASSWRDVELLLPYREGARLAELHELDGGLERDDTADGVVVRARLPAAAAARYERFAATNGRPASP